MKEKTKLITVRLPIKLVENLDSLIMEIEKSLNMQVDRSTVIRAVLDSGIKQLEMETKVRK